MRPLDGPADVFMPAAGGASAPTFPWEAFARATSEALAFTGSTGRVPTEIWVGAESLSPSDYLATLGALVETLVTTGQPPAQVTRRAGTFGADR